MIGLALYRGCVVTGALAVLVACGGRGPPPGPVPVACPPPAEPQVDTVTLRDPELERRATQLALQLWEKEAEAEELQGRLDDARREVVRSMAKLRTLATRAEAASGMAEAEIALQGLRSAAGSQGVVEATQAKRLLDMSAVEFNKQNYGGALYLANQAKTTAVAGSGRLGAAVRDSLRKGEVTFALPVRLQVMGRTNVRDGPGIGFRVLFTLDDGAQITGRSYLGDWVRIADDSARGGWIIHNRVSRRTEAGLTP